MIYTCFKNDPNGKEFTDNLSQIVKHFNINYNTLYNRVINIGLDIDNAININLNNNNKNINKHYYNKIYIVFKDSEREFKGTLKEICNHFNIKYSLLYSRIYYHNINIEEAIDYKKKDKNKIYYKFTVFKGDKDKEFTGNKSEIAKHFNINYNYITKNSISIDNDKINNNDVKHILEIEKSMEYIINRYIKSELNKKRKNKKQ